MYEDAYASLVKPGARWYSCYKLDDFRFDDRVKDGDFVYSRYGEILYMIDRTDKNPFSAVCFGEDFVAMHAIRHKCERGY